MVHDEGQGPAGDRPGLAGPVDRRPLEVLPYADDTGPVDEAQQLRLLVPLLADPLEDLGRDGGLRVEDLHDDGLGTTGQLDLGEMEHGLAAPPDGPQQPVPVRCGVGPDVVCRVARISPRAQ
ncbi:hypothetical protein [Streptomyces aureus]|uniref:hypothetical protein n=1 Tax=Streptomyces aureus TaxID=193461 RepID=UPI00131CE39B|nr:hypothetical protein [Streptomyces aureus]